MGFRLGLISTYSLEKGFQNKEIADVPSKGVVGHISGTSDIFLPAVLSYLCVHVERQGKANRTSQLLLKRAKK